MDLLNSGLTKRIKDFKRQLNSGISNSGENTTDLKSTIIKGKAEPESKSLCKHAGLYTSAVKILGVVAVLDSDDVANGYSLNLIFSVECLPGLQFALSVSTEPPGTTDVSL